MAPVGAPYSGLYELLAEAGRADDTSREQFYGPFFAELRAPGAFPSSMDFFSFAGRQWERLKAELGDSHLYDEEKPFLLGLLVAAAVLVLNMKPMEADAAVHRAFNGGSKKPRLDLLNAELSSLLDQNPDLTAADALEIFDAYDGSGAVVAAEDGTVDWHDSSGKMQKTSCDAIKKRLQRLRRARALHQGEGR